MKYGYTINNKLMANSNGKLLIKGEALDPYNPLNLPPNTFRVRTNDGQPPVNGNYDTATLVKGTTDVYDVYRSDNDFSSLFSNSSNLLEVLGANTRDVISMADMFYYCINLISITLFDTSKVIDMGGMFAHTKIDTVPLFNTSNVESMYGMFYYSGVTSVPLFDTSKVTNMSKMFARTTISSVPLFDTSSVTNMYRMFYYSEVTSVPLFDTSKVTNMSEMFTLNKSLKSVPLFDTSKVTDMSEMFSGCDGLTLIPLFNTSSVTNMDSMFHYALYIESGALALYLQASSQTNVPSHTHTFMNCGINTQTGSAELAQIPSDWKS